MHFFRHFGKFSIFALMVAAPGLVLAASSDGSTVTSKAYVDNKVNTKIPASTTAQVVITPTSATNAAGTRAITTAGSSITGLANSSADGATNIPTAYAVKEAITSATTGMITDVSGKEDKSNKLNGTSGHTIGGLAAGSGAGQDQVMYPSAAAVKEYAVAKNSAITGATKAKITYDSKGLVTGGTDLVASDIPDISATYEINANKVQTIDTTSTKKSSNYPSQAAVEAYVGNLPGATAYTGTGLITVSGHTISTTAEENVQSDWDQTTTTADDYIKNKPTITNASADITGAASTDTKELPTTYAVKTYVNGKVSSANTISSSSTTTAPNEKAVYDQLADKQTKPSSVAEGKVLTYTGSNANTNVSAAFVKVPVASGDPNATSNPATPSTFASIWVE